MTANVLLEELPVCDPAPSQSLSDIVDVYSDELPKTGWLTKLPLTRPRQKLTCLPLATRISKRMVDVAVALTLLTLCAPVMIVTALLVKLTSNGDVIYSQQRVGLNLRKKKTSDRRKVKGYPPEGMDERRVHLDRREEGNFGRPFTMYKFRTMRTDAETAGAQFAQQGDPRVTPIGRFLRRTRIDELPQLWNVLKGDRSMVGPRPERPEFMESLSQDIPKLRRPSGP